MSRLSIAVVALVLTFAGVAGASIEWPPTATADVAVVYDAPDGVVNGPSDTCFGFKDGGFEYSCNKDAEFDMYNEASVAQWIEFEISHTDTYWYVLKPGEYAMDCITMIVKSNGDVGLQFSGFGDKENPEGDLIPVWWAFVFDTIPTPGQWIPASQMEGLFIEEDETHDALWCHLWERILVEECDSACEYESRGHVTVQLLEQKPWVEIVDP